MIVFSPLALYTTYLGWQQYDVLFDALWQTGFLYLGFLMVGYRYLKNVLAPEGSTHHAAEHALNSFLYELTLTFFICAIFVYPCVPLEQKGLSFKPMCTMKKGAEVSESHINNTGTTYDEAFANILSNQVRMPIGFALIQNLFSSFSYGLMKVAGCTDSLQSIQGDLISTYIPGALRQQALQFHRQCFLEARGSYLNEPRSEAEQEQIKKILKRHGGEDDLNWMGSKTFRTFYYGKLRAREPVPGFSYSQYPNSNFESAAKEDASIKSHKPANGYPTCNQWWDKIQADLVKASERAGYFDKHIGRLDVSKRVLDYKEKHQSAWNSDLTPQDYIAKVLIQDNRDLQEQSAESLMNTTNSSIGTSLSRGLVNIGQSVKSYTSTPLKREATLQTLPVMHAFFTFFLIVFTPLVLALSGYSPRALGALCGLYVMAIFVQCIWHYVGILERSVIDPMGDSDLVAAMRNMAVLFYYVAPLLLFKLSSHFGGDAGAGLAGLISSSQSAAETSADSGEKTAKIGLKVASRGML
ncbi:conjugal transfer protein TraG N-terminal domain-containing protein [Legionella feeleii]|uniref:Membrane protein n=1 Tax=Legionella feeleii TaxID=453 RepID=A0A0W0TGZ7_9GAMM|nr:conjugal transfer protein TraG N-terminal domain-containing protein [Legionella feeleii]KTC94872.1 membrane protein [Legionella feeleii]SPX62044.1 membrane protein [Legionella feeleii]